MPQALTSWIEFLLPLVLGLVCLFFWYLFSNCCSLIGHLVRGADEPRYRTPAKIGDKFYILVPEGEYVTLRLAKLKLEQVQKEESWLN